MAKRPPKKGKNKQKAKQMTALGRAINRRQTGLDAMGAQWAKLLADPCNAPLTHPVYPGADGGALVRVESEFTLGDQASQVGAMLVWVPSHPGAESLRGAGFAAPGTPAILTDLSSSSPGYTYVRANSTNARCVAACLQVMWPGSELNRQGFIAVGTTGAGIMTDAGSAVLCPDNTRGLLPTRTKIPDGVVELRWVPSASDYMWVDPTETLVTGSNINSKTALVMTATGLPAAVGVRVRFVAVYEYTPKYNLGVVSPYNSRALSRNSLDDVINYLDRAQPSWRAKIMSVIGGAAYSYFTRPARQQGRIEL